MQSRLDQQVVDLRGLLHELRAIGDQREDEVSARLKAAAEALSVEDRAAQGGRVVFERDARTRAGALSWHNGGTKAFSNSRSGLECFLIAS